MRAHNRVAKCNAVTAAKVPFNQQLNTFFMWMQSYYGNPNFPQANYGLAGGSGKDRAQQQAFSPMASSWVEELGWDELTKTLAANLGGTWYYWQLGDMAVYVTWARGLGICKTDDPSGLNLYWIGKTPSLGAAFHHIRQYLQGRRI